MSLTGLFVPLVTPFTATHELASDALESLAHAVLDDGAAGIVHDLHQPPARLLHANLVRDGFDVGMFETHLARAGGIVGK